MKQVKIQVGDRFVNSVAGSPSGSPSFICFYVFNDIARLNRATIKHPFEMDNFFSIHPSFIAFTVKKVHAQTLIKARSEVYCLAFFSFFGERFLGTFPLVSRPQDCTACSRGP